MNALNILQKTRAQMLLNSPFYGDLVMSLKFEEVKKEELPSNTAGVDPYGNFYFYGPFIEGLTENEVKGLLLHEVFHLVFLHLLRREKRHWETWNFATDLVINNLLLREGFKIPSQGILPENDRYSFGHTQIEQIHKKHAEEVYKILDENSIKVKIDFPSSSLEIDDGKGNKKKYKVFDVHMEGEKPTKGKDKKGEKDSKSVSNKGKEGKDIPNEEKKELEKKWKTIFVDACTRAKRQGNLPGGFEELLDFILRPPKINWKQFLMKEIGNEFPYDWSYSRVSRRSYVCDVIFPGLAKAKFENLIIAIDTSGSMGREELKDILSELRSIYQSFPFVQMTVVQCDCAVQKVTEVKQILDLENVRGVRGRGGTDFRPVFDYVRKNIRRPRFLVYFTDSYGTFPEKNEYGFRTLWVYTDSNSSIKPPFGKKVLLEKKGG